MRQITIGFSRACTTFPIFSWLIMLVQKTPYSHVYLKYEDAYLGQPMYYQASHTLVNYMSESVFLAQETVVKEFTFNISDEAFKAGLLFAANQSGKPYGVMEICGLTLVEAAALFGIKIQNPFKDAGATWICDQLQAALLQQCDNVQLPVPLNDMTPKDMYSLVSSLPANLSNAGE
jgi:hypothetical protein